ncbi:SMC-Scp complex subunit ScpB [Weissella tructae]|jgi:segregation and condensation protein B|uniref:Segregation and condensation protein B n=2 Tax=Weissella TaxID=46255 RepID=A0A075U0E1_9LACO|nr:MULTISPECIES: SMC-Scp complex subunit ScpB [Weissella]AIG65668.1 Segregation and condensation protein B [Weissella tructae]AIM62983.1 Segregation and condensation protein B [Weissella ceti]AIM64382.1 Segregation and condensation protein B [Weissella ceti]ELA06878.1 transcriptional regulator [Weissella ceti NC36]QVV90788.1 SMC-Scp complex subunit ScpB [Weissella tructae]
MTNRQQIEAILFVAGDEGVSVAEMSAITGFSFSAIAQILDDLAEHYVADEHSSLDLLQTDDRYQLVTKVELADTVRRYFTVPLTTSLSQASLEVLAIVAYKQPITRIGIDEIRRVQSQATLQKLMLRNLVEIKGRSKEIGRPNLYGTTDYFLNYFGLNQLTDLPPLGEIDLLEALKTVENTTVPLMNEDVLNETAEEDGEYNG